MTGTNWWKQIVYFTIAKHGKNIGNRNNSLLTIGKHWQKEIFENYDLQECLNALVGNQYFTNPYIITLVAYFLIDFVSEVFIIKITVKENSFK